MIFIILPSKLLIHSSVSPNWVLISSSIFCIPVIIFFSSGWLILIFSSSLLKFPVSVPSGSQIPNSSPIHLTAFWTSLVVPPAGPEQGLEQGGHLPHTAPQDGLTLPSCSFSHLRSQGPHLDSVCGLQLREVRL